MTWHWLLAMGVFYVNSEMKKFVSDHIILESEAILETTHHNTWIVLTITTMNDNPFFITRSIVFEWHFIFQMYTGAIILHFTILCRRQVITMLLNWSFCGDWASEAGTDEKRGTIKVWGLEEFLSKCSIKPFNYWFLQAKIVQQNATEQLQTDRWDQEKAKLQYLRRKQDSSSLLIWAHGGDSAVICVI